MTESHDVAGGEAPKAKEKVDWLEVSATILLGIAAVLVAFSAYQAQLWGGVQDTNNTASVRLMVEASDEFGLGDATRSLDQLLFVDYLGNFDLDPFLSELTRSQLSDDGQIAADVWSDNQEIRPFDDPTYLDSVYGYAGDLYDESFVAFEDATRANENGDNYRLGATIISLVLFFAGVSLVLKSRVTRFVLVAGSGIILGWAGMYVAGLPRV